jgi:DNA-directed RNA polymerase beta' subunit
VQRKIVKINEDIKIEYDGTVRDSKKNIYQFAFGGHGYDPSKVDINEKSGEVYPVNFKRLACRLNDGSEGSYLTQEKINYIIDKCIWNSNIPKNIAAYINNSHISVLQRELKTIKINPEKLERFEQFIITKYNTSRITPGECVGIIGAQCIGEKQTQTNLNTFHTAGKLQNLGVNRFKEILSVSRKLKTKTCIIYFNEKYKTPEDLRMAIKHQIVSVYFKDMYYKTPVYYRINNVTCFEFEFDIKRMFKFKINTVDIKHSLQKTLNDTFSTTNYTIGSTTLLITFNDTDLPFKEYLKILDDILITGMEGVTDIHIMYDNNEWYVVTEGSNLKQMLANPLIDNKRLYCNDFWDVYDCLGIIAVRRMLFQDLKNATANINTLHLKLLVESMTHRGVPCAITRYTMRNNNVGPLSKATFEETVEIIIAAATKTEIETNSGVSAAIISGKQPRVGTNFFDVMVDLKKLPN